jgi:hypothetical protein
MSNLEKKLKAHPDFASPMTKTYVHLTSAHYTGYELKFGITNEFMRHFVYRVIGDLTLKAGHLHITNQMTNGNYY